MEQKKPAAVEFKLSLTTSEQEKIRSAWEKVKNFVSKFVSFSVETKAA